MAACRSVVGIFYADRRALADRVVEQWVTTEDRQRLTAAMHPRRRSEYLAGRALLRHALARYPGSSAASFRIAVAENGKPTCVDGPAISVSHSGDVVVCALASNAVVGIDVETGRPRDAEAIAQRYFTAEEARWLAQDAEPRFSMLWVLKEAYLKALGSGLAGGLASLECRVEPPAIVARAVDGAEPHLALLAGQGCYIGVAALAAGRIAIDVERWAPAGEADAYGPFALLAATPRVETLTSARPRSASPDPR